MRHRTSFVLLAGLLPACEMEPEVPELHYDLNPAALELNADLAADPVARGHLRGALEMLFGTPRDPGYLLLEEWIDEELDPSYGSLELSDAEWEALVAENRGEFDQQLAAIAAGDYGAVRDPREAPDLARDWREIQGGWLELRERVERGEAEQAELTAYVEETRADAELLFAEWYPSLRESSEFYRVECLHCHGTSGGGDGPTAPFLEPRPRDYRLGKFKNTALDQKARPRRQDLLDTLEKGIYGTAMPSFARFSSARLHGLADYVRLLAIRGETEVRLAAEFDPDERLSIDTIQSTYRDVWDEWFEAGDYVIAYEGEVPRPTPERIAHGRELFHEASTANCVSCHGDGGRGDGPSAFETDAEGRVVRVKDDWGNEISPRDLTRGTFRFGRRPIDLFRRIYAGINGTPMPSHSTMKDPQDADRRLLSDEDLWDIVHYVRSLSSHERTTLAAGGDGGGGAAPQPH